MTQRSFYTEKSFLHKGDLHTEAFTRRHVYTQKVLQIEASYGAQKLLHRAAVTHTEAFIPKRSLQREVFTHTEAFAQGNSYTGKLLHTEAFTHRRFLHREVLHRGAFTHKRVCTDKSLHRGVFAQSFYTHTQKKRLRTEKLLHTEAFTLRSFYTKKIQKAFTQKL